METAEMKILRKIINKTVRDKNRNEEIRKICEKILTSGSKTEDRT